MKSFQFFCLALLLATTLFTACSDQEGEAARDKAVESVQVPAPAAPAAAPGNNSGLKHYTCPNNCAGSGGETAGSCPVCGTAYVHNQAFHNNDPASGEITPTEAAPSGEAQNAAGVYHYICSAGCAGGAAAAGNCATCGAALSHNQAFHN